MRTLTTVLLFQGLMFFGCAKDDERIEGTEPGDCTDRADNDADGLFDCDDDGCAGSPDCTGDADADSDADADTDADTDADADADCSDEVAPDVDWLAPGPYAAGRQTHEGVSMLRDIPLVRKTAVYYPATSTTEGAAPRPAEEGYPVVFFEHAGGSHYLNYDEIFSFLAGHGLVIVSTDHTEVDSSGMGWGTSDWWHSHDLLFTDTIAEFETWNETPGHAYEGLLNFDQMGLAGHSHGSALMTMQGMGPMAPYTDYNVRGVALLAPCPDVAISSYLDTYSGMAPLQVIYGSRDQDGCVAYGQSIAIFEPGGSPSHFLHLPGGSHYGFTDEGPMQDATISREDHQVTASAGWLAWWKYTLEADMSALPYLRGDRMLLPDGPETHTQYRERDPLVVDRFTEPGDSTTTWVEVPAIMGIDGQTFINGFLSDTFVDTDVGVALIRSQIEDLLDGVASSASVLFYIDYALGTDVYAIALDDLVAEGRIVLTTAESGSAFAASIDAGGWDLIISATQTGTAHDEHSYDEPLADWICDGGRAIVSDYRVDSTGAASILACSGTAFTTVYNFEEMQSDGALFDGSIALFNPGWGYFSVALSDEDGIATRFAHTDGTAILTGGFEENALGHVPSHTGLDAATPEWMLNDTRGVYHPSWGVTLSWSEPGGHFRQVLDTEAGLDLSGQQALAFRIMQRHDDVRNDGDLQDLSIRLTDASGTTSSVLLSMATQGALRPNPAVGAGTNAKSVYETYRIPLSAFAAASSDLSLEQIQSVDWVFDQTPSGAITIDDVVFAHSGLCD